MGSLPRVLLLAPHWPPEAGAAAARLSGLARELRGLGHELRVVAPTASYLRPAGAPEEDAGARRVAVRGRAGGGAGNALHQLRLWSALRGGARALLREGPADVVLVSSPPPLAALAGLGLRSAGRRLPVVLDLRDLWPDVLVEAGALEAGSPAALALSLVERRLLDGAAAVSVVTRSKLERMAARTSRPLHLVPNGVDRSWHEPAAERREEGGAFEVLYAGNVGRAQDIGLLVRALASAGELSATVVGAGEELEAVRALAQRRRAPVRFEAPEPRERVRERLLRCGCAFVSLRTAALVDAVPSKLLECLALAVPVVLAAAGESAELLRESGGGLVAAPGDEQDLARALWRMRDVGPAERRRMGERGRAFVLERFRREDAARALSRALVEAAA